MNSLNDSPLACNPRSNDVPMEDMIPKKVRFRDVTNSIGSDAPVETTNIPKMSWNDKLIGDSNSQANGLEECDDFEFMEGDVQKSHINGNPTIEFFERINQILIRDMENTIIIKLLGRNIEFVMLQNKIYSLWKPSASF